NLLQQTAIPSQIQILAGEWPEEGEAISYSGNVQQGPGIRRLSTNDNGTPPSIETSKIGA
ncbi:MAG: hypothetical protein O3A92_13115, partial [Verrucomicrobia bacterium]|nr:hypothetical protein [Verrucomicrobiota bacterium]